MTDYLMLLGFFLSHLTFCKNSVVFQPEVNLLFGILIAVDTSAEKAGELDKALIQLEHGVDIAMQVSK